jgi:hypothetical protein
MKTAVKSIILVAIGMALGVMADRALFLLRFDLPRAALVATLRGRSQRLEWTVPAGQRSVEFLIAFPPGKEAGVQSLNGTATFSAEPGVRTVVTLGQPRWEQSGWLDRYGRVGFVLPSDVRSPNQQVDSTIQIDVELDTEPADGAELWAYWAEGRGLFGGR